MGSRYTKSIPEKIYFRDMNNGWFAGPFVKPPRGVKDLIVCTVQREGSSFTEETQRKIAELEKKGEQLKKHLENLPQANNSVSNEELLKLEAWLKSDEGRAKLREAQEKAEETCKIIDKMRDIDPKKLREPFTI